MTVAIHGDTVQARTAGHSPQTRALTGGDVNARQRRAAPVRTVEGFSVHRRAIRVAACLHATENLTRFTVDDGVV